MPRRRPPPESLELSETEMRDMVAAAMDRIVPFLAELPTAPQHRMDGAQKLARALREPLPEGGVSFRRVLGQLFERVIPFGLNTAGPGYLAYIPGGGLFHAAVADLIADATNRYVGIWQAAPGFVQLETNVIRWFADMLGLPAAAGGLLTTGGSLANLAAVVAARHDRLGERFDDGVIYTSTLVHHSIVKAARVAGFRADQVRALPVDARFRLEATALAAAITEDRAAGRRPAMLVASAGTTATGAVDPLPALADLAAAEGLWFHVDAAYGGFFALTARGKATLAGIERADSVTLDPHKGLFLPYGTGCVLVRDLATLRAAHRVGAAYLPTAEADPDFWDFADLGPELSRDFRGLRVWLPLKMHGAAGFRAALDEKLDLAAEACARLSAVPELELVAAPDLSLFAFRVRAATREERNRRTRRLATRVGQVGHVLLTGVDIDGDWLLRVCVLSFRTHRAQIDHLVADVQAIVRESDAAG